MKNKQQWIPASGDKPEISKRVLLKTEISSHPVVGYWDGENWQACLENIFSSCELGFEECKPCGNFASSEVVSYFEF